MRRCKYSKNGPVQNGPVLSKLRVCKASNYLASNQIDFATEDDAKRQFALSQTLNNPRICTRELHEGTIPRWPSTVCCATLQRCSLRWLTALHSSFLFALRCLEFYSLTTGARWAAGGLLRLRRARAQRPDFCCGCFAATCRWRAFDRELSVATVQSVAWGGYSFLLIKRRVVLVVTG
jgi:hypothetical protein